MLTQYLFEGMAYVTVGFGLAVIARYMDKSDLESLDKPSDNKLPVWGWLFIITLWPAICLGGTMVFLMWLLTEGLGKVLRMRF